MADAASSCPYRAAVLASARMPTTGDDASAELHAAAVRLRRLKPGTGTAELVNTALNELVDTWPAEMRPSGEEIIKALSFAYEGTAPLEDAPALAPVAPAPQGRDITAASELSVADALADTDLANRLRWRPGAEAGWWSGVGASWRPCPDRHPKALQDAIRNLLAEWFRRGVITPREVNFLGSSRGIAGAGGLLSARPTMQLPEDTDPPDLLATPRGVLRFSTGAWSEHRSGRFLTRSTPVDPGSHSPWWNRITEHLGVCLGPTAAAVQRYLGSALIGRPPDRRLLWLTGPGADGKSSLCRALRLALGPLAGDVPAQVFAAGARRDAHHLELGAQLMSCRLAVVSEAASTLDWAAVKELSGGDPMTTKRLHGRQVTIRRPPHLLLVSNARPIAPDRAAADRILLAELKPVADADPDLAAVLSTPGPERDALASACLSWLLEGAAGFLAEGLGPVPRFGGDVRPDVGSLLDDMLANGALVLGGGWSPSAAIATALEPLARGCGIEMPTIADLAAALKARIPFKRTEKGSRYGVAVSGMTDHDRPKHTTSLYGRETG